MVDEKYYRVTKVGTPRLPNYDRDEKEAPKTAKWVHVRCPNLPAPGGELAENYILENYIEDGEEGLIDVQYSTDDGGWISIVVEDEEFVDKGASVLMETLDGIDIQVDVDAEINLDDTEEQDGDDEPPRYIQ